jgi:hypothetical protein
LNIDRLHVEKKFERLRKSLLQDARSKSADIMTGLPAPGLKDDCNVMLAAPFGAAALGGPDQ